MEAKNLRIVVFECLATIRQIVTPAAVSLGIAKGSRNIGKGGCAMAALSNPHWEDYAQARASGMSQRKAYRAAYPKSKTWKDSTVDVKASNLEKEDKILVRYQEIKEDAANSAGGAVMTRNEKRKMLAEMARDENLTARERQAAIDIDNRMEDEYVTRVEGSIGVSKLEDLI